MFPDLADALRAAGSLIRRLGTKVRLLHRQELFRAWVNVVDAFVNVGMPM